MTQEEKFLLLQDLCARLPYGVKVKDELGRINKLCIGNADLVRLYYNDFSIYGEKSLSIPLLRPMSSMTEDEKEEYNKLFTIHSQGETYCKNWEWIDFMNSHHFDYRGLIGKGLALEAPGEVYNLKKKV